MATETKSGLLVKTPGKFATCVTGKHKNHKSRKADSTLNSTVPAEITSTSLMVNTSLQDTSYDYDTESEMTAYSCAETEKDNGISDFKESDNIHE